MCEVCGKMFFNDDEECPGKPIERHTPQSPSTDMGELVVLRRYRFHMETACKVGTATERQMLTNAMCCLREQLQSTQEKLKEVEKRHDERMIELARLLSIHDSILADAEKVWKALDKLKALVDWSYINDDPVLPEWLVEALSTELAKRFKKEKSDAGNQAKG